MATYRYTGRDLFLAWNGTPVSADWLEFSVERQVHLIDVTTLADADKQYLRGVESGTWRLRVFDTAGGGSLLLQTLALGASGTLEWAPRGTTASNPRFAFVAIVTDVQQPYTVQDAVVYTFAGVKSGPML